MKTKVLVSFILILFFYNFYPKKVNQKTIKILDLAHRGYASKNQESTLQAFQYAIKKDTDGLEFDIRQTKDNILIVTHNQEIDELKEKVKNLNYIKIKEYTNILTFKSLVKLAKKHKKDIWVEVKDSELYPKILNNMLKVIKEENYDKKTIIQSFKLSDLEYIHNKNINIKLMKLYLFQYSFNKLPKYIDYIGLPILTGIIHQNVIHYAHKQSFKIIFWRESIFFEKKYFIQKLINRGADGFMLNSPLNNFLN